LSATLRRIVPALVALLVLGAFAAGCGSDNKKSGTTTSASTASTPATTPTTTASTSGTTSGGTVNQAAADQIIKSCETAINANPAVKASLKTDLINLCKEAGNAAAKGDQAGVLAANKKVCIKIADSLPDAAKATAKAACDQVGTAAN
jgi:hypothetical protein